MLQKTKGNCVRPWARSFAGSISSSCQDEDIHNTWAPLACNWKDVAIGLNTIDYVLGCAKQVMDFRCSNVCCIRILSNWDQYICLDTISDMGHKIYMFIHRWMDEWMCIWVGGWTDERRDWSSDWLLFRLIDWLIDCLIDWLIHKNLNRILENRILKLLCLFQ
jgi:hypothetical protein